MRKKAKIAGDPVLPFDRIGTVGIVLPSRQSHDGPRRNNTGYLPEAIDNGIERLSRMEMILESGLFAHRTACRCMCVHHQEVILVKADGHIGEREKRSKE